MCLEADLIREEANTLSEYTQEKRELIERPLHKDFTLLWGLSIPLVADLLHIGHGLHTK